MIGVELQGREKFEARLRKIEDRARNLQPFFDASGLYMVRSITKNFRAEGRPTKWKKSVRAAVVGGKTLRDTSVMLNSITYEADANGATIGTVAPQARILHYGGVIRAKNAPYLVFNIFGGRQKQAKKKGEGSGWRKKKSVTMPARPFMMFQLEDIPALNRIAKRIMFDDN